ncbi:MAG: hypothetical protein GY865_10260, partial [candidate division Zixibacteria bacterium]|nr:hypothetical protein [candidate division Zixibacteria bacterium]
VCELFYLLHGSKRNYKEILAIANNDDVSKILYALKKTPGIVEFENNELKYTALFGHPMVKFINQTVSKWLTYAMGACTICLIIIFPMTDGITSFTFLIFIIPCFAVLTMQIKDMRYEQMVNEMVQDNEI